MAPIELPAKAAAIYDKLSKKYQVEFEPLKLSDRELQILKVTDIEPFLAGQDPLKDVTSFPIWLKLWEASMMLAQVIARQPAAPGRTFLEVGAGLGAVGLAAAAQGYQVTMSDYDPLILEFQEVSAAANGFADMDFRIIDWLQPPELPPFDIIAGAEVVFREELFEPLLNLFSRLLKPAGTIYLAHDARRKSLLPFLRRAEKKFAIAAQKYVMRTDDQDYTIILNRLRPRT